MSNNEPNAEVSSWTIKTRVACGVYTVLLLACIIYASRTHEHWKTQRVWMASFDQHTKDGGVVLVTKDGNVKLTPAQAEAKAEVLSRALTDLEENARRLRNEERIKDLLRGMGLQVLKKSGPARPPNSDRDDPQ